MERFFHHGDIPAAGGTYVLLLATSGRHLVRAGALGTLILRPGFHAYAGSALGPGGLRARLGHHFRISDRPHWHIDYIRALAHLEAVWFLTGRECREHAWAAALSGLRGATPLAPGFGSSDCRCPAHCYHFPSAPPARSLLRAIRRDDPSHPPLTVLAPSVVR